jgi:hypothetical protein
MAGTADISIRTRVAGVNIDATIRRTDELEQAFRATMSAGRVGTLSTRTDDNTGILTVASGHGITDADTVAVFWEGGSRYGVDVTATTSTTISIDLGAGANLPIATTPIVVAKESEHVLAIIGNDIAVIAAGCDNRASLNFRDSGDASLLRYDMATKEGRVWFASSDVTNPLAGDTVANIVIANGGTTEAELRIGMLLNTASSLP